MYVLQRATTLQLSLAPWGGGQHQCPNQQKGGGATKAMREARAMHAGLIRKASWQGGQQGCTGLTLALTLTLTLNYERAL
jgi:hypothetical protein